MTKKYSEFFRKHGNPTSVIPEMLVKLQANGSTESRSLYYVKKADEAASQGKMTSQEEIITNIGKAPDEKMVVLFNVQFMDTLKEADFLALDAYIEMAGQRNRRKEFYRGFSHGPAVLCAFPKKQGTENVNGVNNFSGYPTVALYL